MEKNSSTSSVLEKGANYIFHLMNVSITGLDSEYASKYNYTVLPEDRNFINENRDLLAFYEGELGDIARAVIFFPACLNLSDKRELEDYFINLNLTLEKEDPAIFIEKYDSGKEKLINWFSPVNGSYLKSIVPFKSIIKKLGELYLRNFKKFEESVWEFEKEKLEEVALSLNQTLNESNLLQIWEAVTGERFEYGTFEAIICSGSKNIHITNILGYDRAFFYSGDNQKSLLQIVSHEIGSFVLINVLKKALTAAEFDLNDVRRAFENLVIFYNSIILGKSHPCYKSGKYFDNVFIEIYNKLYLREYDLKPEKLLNEGIKNYIENFENNSEAKKFSF